MKRIFALLTALLLLACALPVSAWEVSDEALAFAAEILPGYQVLSSCQSGGAQMLLLQDAQGRTVFAGCVPETDGWRVTLSPPLPEELFWIADGCCFDDTAMLLLESFDGQTYFAGFVREGDAWRVTLSAPLPEDTPAGLDTFHAGEGGVRVHLQLPEDRRAYDDVDTIFAVVELQADGSTWAVTCVNTGWEVIAFQRHGIYDDTGYPFYGAVTLPLDVTQLDWAALPASFGQAMALVDASGWAIVNRDGAPVHAEADPDSAVLLYAAEGAPVEVLVEQAGMVQVGFIGSGTPCGWMAAEELLPAAEQMSLDEDGYWYNRHPAQELGIMDETVTLHAALHDESTASPLVIDGSEEALILLGWCPEGCCCVYRETTGEGAYMPIEYIPEEYLP